MLFYLIPRTSIRSVLAGLVLFLLIYSLGPSMLAAQPSPSNLVPRFSMESTPLHLERPTNAGAFVNVVGRKSAMFGYENRTFEAWVYPLKLIRDFKLSVQIADYPGTFDGLSMMAHIDVRPEATTITYRHAAFTIRQIMYAPVDEMGVIMLLDIDTVRPLELTVSFRPDLRLMWPAGLMTGNLGWDATRERYSIVEETRRFVGVIGSPGARDISVMPYQEEPQDIPTSFVLSIDPDEAKSNLYPIVLAGAVNGYEAAHETYDRLLANAAPLYNQNVTYYNELLERTIEFETPDERLNEAYDWARIGIEKGLATNPYLGTGFVAGYRTAGNSERPGFAWYFGRDALWTAYALTAEGDFANSRTALDFLAQFQRDDGKIPHEISQSASLLPWFDDYPYAWSSADATPMYIIAHADLYRSSGDRAYLERHWPSLKRAFEFTRTTDTDGDGLIENFNRPDGPDFGHGWVEGGELYPAKEELYMQGLWLQACADMASLADLLGEPDVATAARAAAARTKEATEANYWNEEAGHYAFSSENSGDAFWFEDTVLPGVPMWWGVLDEARAQLTVDHLGAASLATDWGARILSAESDRYDPLSYHNGSVWPLFTGWASMGAYTYDRAHVGYQALMATALLTRQDALGYVTELLSGDYNTAFGRSSHHQVWSEAMVITPALRGMIGYHVTSGGQVLHLGPQVPVDWDTFAVRQLKTGDATYDFVAERSLGEDRYTLTRTSDNQASQLAFAPALPLDAIVTDITVDGQVHDIAFCQ